MLSPEEAMNKARETAAPIIERIEKVIDKRLNTYIGAGSITVDIPRFLKGKGKSAPTEVLTFMVDMVANGYRKPTTSGSRWDVRVGEMTEKKGSDDPSKVEEFYPLTFTPVLPPAATHPD